jgi:hypothetical protein
VTAPAPGRRTTGQRSRDPVGDGSQDGIRRLLAAGASSACMAAGIGLAVLTVLVVAGWIAAPHVGLGLIGIVRTAAVLWLVAHHVTVQVSGAGRIGMLPLGLVALPGALLWRAGRSVVRAHHVTELRQVVAATLAVAVPYSALAGALAVGSRSALAAASVPEALVASFAIAMVAAGFGAARALAPRAQLGALVSGRTRAVLVGTAGSVAVLGAAGAMATALALAAQLHNFNAVYQLLDPGIVGAVLLLLAQLAYLPNGVIWAVAYMLGPGFAVGTGTVAAPSGSVLGPMPAFPLLAALPVGSHGSQPGWLVGVMLAVPYIAGIVAGLLVVRVATTNVLESAPIRGFCSGALTGCVLGVGAAFAGGPLGDGRLAAVGPSAWQVAAVSSLEVGVAAAVTAGAVNWWYLRNSLRDAAIQHAAGIGPPSGSPPARSADEAWPAFAAQPDEDGHVIYLDRWAGTGDRTPQVKRPGGPSALP